MRWPIVPLSAWSSAVEIFIVRSNGRSPSSTCWRISNRALEAVVGLENLGAEDLAGDADPPGPWRRRGAAPAPGRSGPRPGHEPGGRPPPQVAAASSPAWPATKASTLSSRPSTSASAPSRAAGSSQSRSRAAFRLEAARFRHASLRWRRRRFLRPAPAPAAPRSRPRALRRACPIKFKVSSTRPAPNKGLESSAARSARAPNAFVRAASPTVRSRPAAGPGHARSAARGTPPGCPWNTAAPQRPCSPGTSCQRRSITVASITSSSLTLV